MGVNLLLPAVLDIRAASLPEYFEYGDVSLVVCKYIKGRDSDSYLGPQFVYTSELFLGGYCGTQYRVRSYPPLGYSILYYLTRFNHQKTLLIWAVCLNVSSRA